MPAMNDSRRIAMQWYCGTLELVASGCGSFYCRLQFSATHKGRGCFLRCVSPQGRYYWWTRPTRKKMNLIATRTRIIGTFWMVGGLVAGLAGFGDPSCEKFKLRPTRRRQAKAARQNLNLQPITSSQLRQSTLCSLITTSTLIWPAAPTRITMGMATSKLSF
jgi:hypothetical protein